jgi:hypothetical protein
MDTDVKATPVVVSNGPVSAPVAIMSNQEGREFTKSDETTVPVVTAMNQKYLEVFK